jgi:hypothetical protein
MYCCRLIPLIILPLVAWPQDGEALPWRRVGPPNKAFAIQFPGQPQQQTQKLKIPTGTLEVQNYILKPQSGQPGFFVTYSEKVESPVRPSQPVTQLANARKAALDTTKGQVVSERKLKLGPHPGLELLIALPNGMHLRTRLYVVNNRFYEVFAVGTRTQVTGPAADKFLESFRLTGG